MISWPTSSHIFLLEATKIKEVYPTWFGAQREAWKSWQLGTEAFSSLCLEWEGPPTPVSELLLGSVKGAEGLGQL